MIGRTVRLSIVCEPGGIELLPVRVLVVAQQEDDLAGLAGLKLDLDVVRADGRPAVGHRVERLAALDGRRPVPAAVWSQERVALRIKAGQRL